MPRYRCGWGNGPPNPAPGMHRAKQVPGTSIHVADGFLPCMDYCHLRVNHTADGSYPNQTAWTWYTRWRDLLATNPAHADRIRGIGIDEVITNLVNTPALMAKMADVNYWCDASGTRRPDWVVAITPGSPDAVDRVVGSLAAGFPGRVWWFAETYLACYKAPEGDLGLGQCRLLLDRLCAAGQHGRTLYAFNHSHYTPVGQPVGCAYHNAYGTAPTVRNQAVYDATAAFCADVVARGEPFGWGFWTPSYSSELSRSDHDEILAGVGG